jgi:NAD(P)-dependent dehydrogenase (short-subunit alcohol dehydrogenase family)
LAPAIHSTSLITTPFGSQSTAAEVLEGIELNGKRAIVTGGASGIGFEAARALAGAGAEVTLAVRDRAAGVRAAAAIESEGTHARVQVALMDLADRASIRKFISGWTGPLEILINNAGVMMIPDLTHDSEGWEMQFSTNHLGHFALSVGLHRALAAAESARIVCVSSRAHLESPVVFDDINFDVRRYHAGLAYSQSKTANVLFAIGAAERWRADTIFANALMPGVIRTNLTRYLSADWEERSREQIGADFSIKTPEQGAATSVLLAASPLLDGVGGRYFEDCNEAAVVAPRSDARVPRGVATYAVDRDNAHRLWELSLGVLACSS